MIYFIQDVASGAIKIGFSERPWARLGKVQSDTPGEVTLLAVQIGERGDEAALHAKFSAHRTRGEWFAPVAEILAHVAAQAPMEKRKRGPKNIAGKTDEELSAIAGVSRSQICRIRNGKSRPSLSTALAIAKATGVPVETFAA